MQQIVERPILFQTNPRRINWDAIHASRPPALSHLTLAQLKKAYKNFRKKRWRAMQRLHQKAQAEKQKAGFDLLSNLAHPFRTF